MRVRGKVIVLLLCFIYGCNSSDKPITLDVAKITPVDSTSLFSNYLQKKHNLKLAKKQHCYIVIPTTGCGLCINTTTKYLLSGFEKLDTSKITFIVSNGTWLKDSVFNLKANYKSDKACKIDELDLHIINVTLIYVNKSKIDSIKSISSQEAKNVIQHCPQIK